MGWTDNILKCDQDYLQYGVNKVVRRVVDQAVGHSGLIGLCLLAYSAYLLRTTKQFVEQAVVESHSQTLPPESKSSSAPQDQAILKIKKDKYTRPALIAIATGIASFFCFGVAYLQQGKS